MTDASRPDGSRDRPRVTGELESGECGRAGISGVDPWLRANNSTALRNPSQGKTGEGEGRGRGGVFRFLLSEFKVRREEIMAYFHQEAVVMSLFIT